MDSIPSLETANTNFEHSPNNLTITEAFLQKQSCHHSHSFLAYQLVKKGVRTILVSPSWYRTGLFAVHPASICLQFRSFYLNYDLQQAVTSLAAVRSLADPFSWRSASRHLNTATRIANQAFQPLPAAQL